MADLFGETPAQVTETEVTQDPIEILSQKFKDAEGKLDVAGLAKGKLESDKHIANLESELRGLRKELDTRLNYEQFLDEIKSAKATSSQVTNPETNEAKALEKDDIAKLVRDTISQERTQAQREHNIRETQKALTKVWGAEYESRTIARINELGLTKEQANQLAATSPAAFIKLVDAIPQTRTPEPSIAPPSGNLRSAVQLDGGKRDYNYYEKLRKSDPSRYWHSKTQQRMHNDMFDQGEDFGIKLS